MIPTHKDLNQNVWLQEGIQDRYRLYSNNNKPLLINRGKVKLGQIWYFPTSGTVYIGCHISGLNGKSVQVPVRLPFNYIDYIPEWEKLMDELLKTIFK